VKSPHEESLQLLGQSVRIHSTAAPEELQRATSILEDTFRDMERAYELRWGVPPSALDTSTWLLMGALNLAHRVARLEQDNSRQTQDLELTLSKLLDDVPDEEETPAGPLFQGNDPGTDI
jgi:cell division protein ZapA (FtsZ GTPase activity inhibitor)